jgi:HSP20 family protein
MQAIAIGRGAGGPICRPARCIAPRVSDRSRPCDHQRSFRILEDPEPTDPAELSARANEFERRFDWTVEEFRRRPFPSLLRPEQWWPVEGGMMTRMPAVDVYEDKDDVVIKAELPGLSKEDIGVEVADATLTIKGEKKREETIKEEDYYCCERAFGSFTRAVDLPCEVQADQVKASFKNGVLEVRMPKTEEAKNKSITVTID